MRVKHKKENEGKLTWIKSRLKKKIIN